MAGTDAGWAKAVPHSFDLEPPAPVSFEAAD
jgi:hypothetical protein